jgi:hypothetical protein
MDLKDLATNRNLEIEGKWVRVDRETELLIARWHNPKHRASLQKHYRGQGSTVIPLEMLDEEIADEIIIESMADAILLGWRGLKDKGQLVDYSRQAAYDRLATYPVFRDSVTEYAKRWSNFVDAAEEEAGKDSSST